jgi:hypothetical protein
MRATVTPGDPDMTTTPGDSPSYTTHELYALSGPFTRDASRGGPGAVFGFPGPDPDPALYAAGLSTLALRKKLVLDSRARRIDPGTAAIARLFETATGWLRLLIATDGGRQAARIGTGPEGHAIFTQERTGTHAVDLLAATGDLSDDLTQILDAVIRPVADRGEAVLLASFHDASGERLSNLRIAPGVITLAAAPVGMDGRLSEVTLEGPEVAGRAMATRLLGTAPPAS